MEVRWGGQRPTCRDRGKDPPALQALPVVQPAQEAPYHKFSNIACRTRARQGKGEKKEKKGGPAIWEGGEKHTPALNSRKGGGAKHPPLSL